MLAKTMNHQILHTLENKNVRPTPMRMLVLEQFLQNRTARSLGELEAAMPRADRITIYRALRTFEEKGILHAITDGSGATHYALCPDACEPEHHRDFHPHFHCIRCGRTLCLDITTKPPASLPDGYQLLDMEVQLRGVCPECH